MPIPELKTRSYGYVGSSEERQGGAHGDGPHKKNKPSPRHSWLRFPLLLLLLPLRLVSLIFRGLGYLWRRRPRLSSSTKKNLRRKLIGGIISIGVLGLLGGTIMVAWVSKDLPDPNRLTDRPIAQSTKIYDRTGQHLLYEIFSEEKRTLINLEDIPPQLIQGLIATEDKIFYEHHGIRPLSIARSIVYGLLGKGRVGSGASTLTQQLVKNAILTNERSYVRKLKEVILSLRLEQKYTKDQILKIYFNEIPYGSTNYGVEAAARSYFGKSAKELNLAESATLAGMPKAPSHYLQNPDALQRRRDFVLERMFEEGYITGGEKDAAQAEPLVLAQRYQDIKAPHFVLYVKQQLVEKYGEKLIDTGGFHVLTSLDWNLQQIAEQAIKDADKTFVQANADNAGFVAIQPKNGQVIAMIGSRDFSNTSTQRWFNVATQSKRQPGSSIKPIVYAAAFEKGYTPDTVLFDVQTNFAASGKPYIPKNYDLQERGPVTMRQALQGSLNIPAVQTLYLVGEEKAKNMAERLGYTTLNDQNLGLSLVLGGGGVRLLEHVSAYATLANNGLRYAPVSILKVEDGNGDVLYEWKLDRGERVVDEKVAATVSHVLSDDEARAYIFGRNGLLTLPGRPVAAKTGTTNDYKDAWTVGYTPSLAAGVWAGNSSGAAMKEGFGGSRVAGSIWNQFMKKALEGIPTETFPTPPPNDAEKPVLRGSQGGAITLEVDKVTGKLATSSTPRAFVVQRTYLPQHSILHYVNKDDPRGPIPTDPSLDPQYPIWEAAIQDWIQRKKITNPNWEASFSEPPTEYDDIHSLALIPTLEVVSPAPSSTLVSRQLTTDIRVSAPRGVSQVVYRLDQTYVGVVRLHPFNLSYYASGLENGPHTLTIIVEDDIGNRREEVIPFTLEASEELPTVSWLERDRTIKQSEFPRSLLLSHIKLSDIQRVVIYLEESGGSRRTTLATVSDFSSLINNQILFSWPTPPDVGTWRLVAEVTTKNGISRQSDAITVTIEN